MAFGDFDLRGVVDTFGLQKERDTTLFPHVAPLEPSEYLRAWLNEFSHVGLAMNTESARNIYLIAPILIEAKRRARGPVNVFPGYGFEADHKRGLNGVCDYLISRSESIYYLRAPRAAVIQAKKEDLIGGFGPCIATMVGIQTFNEREGIVASEVYGCVTSGNMWRFLRLEGPRLFIDACEYYLCDVGGVIGILVQIMSGIESSDDTQPGVIIAQSVR